MTCQLTAMFACFFRFSLIGQTFLCHVSFVTWCLAEPYFTYPLSDQHVDVGSRLSWHCVALGKPLPTYLWYKNGVLLRSSPGLPGHTLHVYLYVRTYICIHSTNSGLLLNEPIYLKQQECFFRDIIAGYYSYSSFVYLAREMVRDV